jgi:uroporphyrinogen-III synthase
MILIIRHRDLDIEFKSKLDKNNYNYLYQPVLHFNYVKNKIINSENKIFIIASIQAVKSIRLQRNEYFSLIKDAQLFVIGKKVKEALVKLGVNNIIKTFDTTTSLLKFIQKNNFYKKIKFEYLCGSVVNDEFIHEMKMKKFTLRKKIVYEVTPVAQLLERTKAVIRNGDIKVIVFYSVYSAKIFLKLLRKYGLLSSINREVTILCFSKRILNNLSSGKLLPSKKIHAIKNPNSELLFQYIKKKLN